MRNSGPVGWLLSLEAPVSTQDTEALGGDQVPVSCSYHRSGNAGLGRKQFGRGRRRELRCVTLIDLRPASGNASSVTLLNLTSSPSRQYWINPCSCLWTTGGWIAALLALKLSKLCPPEPPYFAFSGLIFGQVGTPIAASPGLIALIFAKMMLSSPQVW